MCNKMSQTLIFEILITISKNPLESLIYGLLETQVLNFLVIFFFNIGFVGTAIIGKT